VGNVLVEDVADESKASAWIHLVPQQRVEADPSLGWIDARIVFPQYPDLGQGLGGAFTTQSANGLDIEGGAPKILVSVDGALRDERGATVADSTSGYRWISLHHDPRKLFCFGRCLVVGVGNDGGIPLQASPEDARGMPSRWLSPWLLVADVPPSGRGVVRFIETYDRNWAAFALPGARPLRHLRLDATINGWRLPAGDVPSKILIVNVLAVVQLLAGLVGFVTAILIVVRFTQTYGPVVFRRG
jgi:hypothetical protein